MTKTAVDYQKVQADKEAARIANEINLKKANITQAELEEAIRHNKVEELLAERKVNQSLAKTILDGIGSVGSAAANIGKAATMVAAMNDESYHNKLTTAYEQATKLPFSERGGNPANLIKAGTSTPGSVDAAYTQRVAALPAYNSGIIHVRYVPTIGTHRQQVESSELQNNVRLLWTPVRQSNSGAVNSYDQSDLFQMTLASSSVFEILRLISRPLNYLNAKRKQMNTLSAWDKTMLAVMCGSMANAEFIIDNQTDIVQSINSCIRSFNSQALPIGFDLTKRRSLLNGRIFTFDGDRDEYYVFSPSVYYVYDEASATLVARPLDLRLLFSSITNMKTVISNMLNPLVNGTVTSIMAGDMKKAFPKQVAVIRELPLKFNGDIYSKDEHILEALRNGTIIDFEVDDTKNIFHQNFDIKQGVNANQDTYIYQGRLNSANEAYLTAKMTQTTLFSNYLLQIEGAAGSMIGDVETVKILDVKTDNPQPYDIMAGTRFMTTEKQVRTYDNTNFYSQVTEVYQWGSEILNQIEVYGFTDPSVYKINDITQAMISFSGNYYGWCTGFSTSMRRMYERFHYLPQWYNTYIYMDRCDGSDVDSFEKTNLIHSIYNTRIMSERELGNLHVASFGSLVSITTSVDNNLEK